MYDINIFIYICKGTFFFLPSSFLTLLVVPCFVSLLFKTSNIFQICIFVNSHVIVFKASWYLKLYQVVYLKDNFESWGLLNLTFPSSSHLLQAQKCEARVMGYIFCLSKCVLVDNILIVETLSFFVFCKPCKIPMLSRWPCKYVSEKLVELIVLRIKCHRFCHYYLWSSIG